MTRPYISSNTPYDVSPEDLMKACKSLLSHIDWSQVALDVVDNKLPPSCRAGLQESLQAKVETILIKACNDSIVRERDDIYSQQAEDKGELDVYIESGDDGSSEESYKDSFVESDKESYEGSFVESDFSEAGSSEYQKSDDDVDAEEVEDGVEDLRKICDICHKSMNATEHP